MKGSKNMNTNNKSKRSFLKTSVLAIATATGAALTAKSQVCSITPRQTSGPFIPDDFPFRAANEGAPYFKTSDSDADLTRLSDGSSSNLPKGQIIILQGVIKNLQCQPVPSANVYLWQADNEGHYNHTEDPNVTNPNLQLDPNFQYRGHVVTDADGKFSFKTIKPKYYPLDPSDTSQLRTAHLHLAVTHPKYRTLITQSYFEGDVLEDIEIIRRLNKKDIILSPNGVIRPELKSLIVNFKRTAEIKDPVGYLELTI